MTDPVDTDASVRSIQRELADGAVLYAIARACDLSMSQAKRVCAALADLPLRQAVRICMAARRDRVREQERLRAYDDGRRQRAARKARRTT